MTRPWRLVLAASAVVFLAAFAVAQATDTAPLIPTTTTVSDHQAELAAVARTTGCYVLLSDYNLHHQVWKQAVKKHDPAEDAAHLALMRAILLRKAWLEERGRCGG